jgi:hypothetical protein
MEALHGNEIWERLTMSFDAGQTSTTTTTGE